jgi:hypothetical protein
MYWVKRKIRQIRRVIDFLPLLWNGFDFDYRYALELFRKQLERQAKFMESDKAMTLSAKTNAQKIRTAIRLMDKVYGEEYASEYMVEIDKLYGTTHYEFVDIGGRNENGDSITNLVLRNENAVDDEHQKEINEVRHQMMIQSRNKQNRAHKLLWDFIEHNIQAWWD